MLEAAILYSIEKKTFLYSVKEYKGRNVMNVVQQTSSTEKTPTTNHG